MKTLFLASSMLVIAVFSAIAADNPHKLGAATAKQLLETARAQEAHGDLKAATESCMHALALVESKAAESELRNIRKAGRTRAKAEFEHARSQYAAADYAGALHSLLQAQAYAENSRSIAHNLAVIHRQLNQQAEASAWLNVEMQLSKPEDRPRVGAIQASLIAPGQVAADWNTKAQAWNTNLDQVQLGNRDAGPAQLAACDTLGHWKPDPQSPPTLFYDMAQCAQYAGDFKAAAEDLDQYLRLAPEALDATAVGRQLQFLRQLTSLGDRAAEAQRSVGNAFLLLEKRQPNLAKQAMEKANSLLPNNPALEERLAVMAEWSGDFGQAAPLWRRAADDEQEPEWKARLQLLAAGVNAREAQFKEPLEKARTMMRALLNHYVVDGEAPSAAYVSAQLSEADRYLGDAASIAPLSPELHQLYLFSALQRNDMASASKSIQILDSAGVPVSLYGWIFFRPINEEKDKDRRPREFVKVELDNHMFHLTNISTCNLKKHKSTPAAGMEGSDRLGGFGSVQPLAGQTRADINVGKDQIKKIETKDEFVYVQIDDKTVKHRKLLIEPVQMASEVPLKGPGARHYANQYTSLLSARLEFDGARLGKERMTFGEKMEMVSKFANLAFDVYGAVGNPLGAYSAIRDAQQLSRYMSAMRAHTLSGVPLQLETSLEYRLRPLPTETLAKNFVEPDPSDALMR